MYNKYNMLYIEARPLTGFFRILPHPFVARDAPAAALIASLIALT